MNQLGAPLTEEEQRLLNNPELITADTQVPGQQESPSAPLSGAPGQTSPQVPVEPSAEGDLDSQTTKKKRGSLTDIALGVTAGAARGVPAAVGGTLDFAGDIGTLGGTLIANSIRDTPLAAPVGNAARSFSSSAPIRAFYRAFGHESVEGRTDFKSVLSLEEQAGTIGNDTANAITTEFVAVVAGFGKLKSLAKNSSNTLLARAGASNSIAANAAFGAAADLTVLSADDETIANSIAEIGLLPEFLSYLETDEDDGVFERRFKNVLEGAGLGVGIDVAFKGVRALRARNKGNVEEASKLDAEVASEVRESLSKAGIDPDAPKPTPTLNTPASSTADLLDKSFAASRQLDEQAGVVPDGPAKPKENANRSGDNPSLAERAKKAVGAGEDTVLRDANELLKKVDAEAIDSIEVDGLGRIIVKSEDDFAKLSDAGATEAFTTTARAVPSENINVIRSGGESSRPVAAVTDESIANLKTRVKELIDDPDAPLNTRADSNVGQVKVEGIGHSRDVDVVARGLLDSLGEVKQAASTVDIAKQVRSAVDAIGTDQNQLLKVAESISDKTDNVGGAVLVLRELWTNSIDSVKQHIDLDVQGLDEASIDGIRSNIHTSLILAHRFSVAGSDLGRGLRALRIPNLEQYLNSSRTRTKNCAL